MSKKILVTLAAFLMVFGLANAALAISFTTPNENNDAGPDINDAINSVLNNILGLGVDYEYNADVDNRRVNPDEIWESSDGWENSPILLVGLSAGNTNSTGYYTDPGQGSNLTELLGGTSGFGLSGYGTQSNPFNMGTLFPKKDLGSFGWYLTSQSGNSSNTFYSETALNGDGKDHMLAYALPEFYDTPKDTAPRVYWKEDDQTMSRRLDDVYLLAWEDLFNGGDGDYDDMMYLVARVEPVPEPGTILLLGIGLLGLGAVSRKRLRK